MRERPAGRPVMRQRWAGLGFFHWPVDPEIISERLPPGIFVDTFEGSAWLGVVPFFMERVRPVGMPTVPKVSWFLELNVRTYVHDRSGNSGVWFFSLDCNQSMAVRIARRFFHLPYEHAAMNAETRDGSIHYECRRKSGSHPAAVFDYPVATNPAPAALGSLEWFLVERYLLFSADRAGNLFLGRVNHQPYWIEKMASATWADGPLGWDGFPRPGTAPVSMLCAAPVDVEVFPLRRLVTASSTGTRLG